MGDIRSALSIKTENEKLEPLLREAVNKVRDTGAESMTLRTIYKDLREEIHDIRKTGAASLNVSYQGERISFSLDIPTFNYMDRRAYSTTYWESNEAYSANIIKDIGMLEGIDGYIGISGGLSQNMMLIAVLQQGNMIRSVDLCDLNQNQLVYNVLQLVGYDAFPDAFSPLRHIKNGEIGTAVAASKEVYPIYTIKRGTTFRLHATTITHMIEGSRGIGVKFVYSSNAFEVKLDVISNTEGKNTRRISCWMDNCWNRWPMAYSKILQPIMGNGKMLEGTVHMAASTVSGRTTLTEKSSSKMLAYAYCDGTSEHTDCIHPSVELRR
jgi:hypothetical protein